MSERFDLVGHLERQRAFSAKTFGPGARTKGVLNHIRKELAEIEADPFDIREWVDVIILAFDGAWRAGWEPNAIVEAIVAKQAKNEARVWPDWRTADPDKAIEHDRSHDAATFSPPPHATTLRNRLAALRAPVTGDLAVAIADPTKARASLIAANAARIEEVEAALRMVEGGADRVAGAGDATEIAYWLAREVMGSREKGEQAIADALAEARANALEEARAKALEDAQDKIDGLEADLDSALDVLWRRGDDGAREWIRMNYRSKVKALIASAKARTKRDASHV